MFSQLWQHRGQYLKAQILFIAQPVDLRAVCDKLLTELGVARKVAKSEPSSPADPVSAVWFEIAPAEENTPEAAMLRFSMVVFLIAIALWTNVSVGGSVGYCPV